MIRDEHDQQLCDTNHSAWKNGRRFQTHHAAVDGFLFPGSSAGERVRLRGPANAIQDARAHADLHPVGSREREFYTAAAALVKAGTMARLDHLLTLKRPMTEAELTEAVACQRACITGVGV